MGFAIFSREEAAGYLGHSVLGSRLKECTALVNVVQDRTVLEIFGSPDDLKFHSSMTLFDAVSPELEFAEAISKFYGGKPDQEDAGSARVLDKTLLSNRKPQSSFALTEARHERHRPAFPRFELIAVSTAPSAAAEELRYLERKGLDGGLNDAVTTLGPEGPSFCSRESLVPASGR